MISNLPQRVLPVLLALSIIILFGCKGKTGELKKNVDKSNITSTKETLLDVDRAFSDLSIVRGVAVAFDSFSADDATMFRNHADPFVGREVIHNLQSQAPAQGTLEWQPYYADIASSGELGYTLGKWQYTLIDSANTPQVSNGYYVTIWKKQADGRWKFVFDNGVSGPPPTEKK